MLLPSKFDEELRGELSPKAQNDTMHRPKNQHAHKKRFTKTPNRHRQKARHATPSGEWLGLSAEEGRGKPRKTPGKRMQL
jgi:hypothetical protein